MARMMNSFFAKLVLAFLAIQITSSGKVERVNLWNFLRHASDAV